MSSLLTFPVERSNIQDISEFVKWITFLLEQIAHHMHPAPIKAVVNVFLVLPESPQPFLYIEGVGKFPDLLKLVDADYHLTALPFRNDLREPEDFFRGMSFRCDAKRD